MYLFWIFIWFIYFSAFSSKGWLRMMTLILSILVLTVSFVTLIVAYLSFWISRRFLYYQLLSRYSESEMGKALEIMWDLFETRKADESAFFSILKQYRNCCETKDYNARLVEVKTVMLPSGGSRHVQYFGHGFRDTNQARRQVSHFFITAYEMFSEMKALDKTCFKTICELNSLKLLYYVVEWLEFAHATSWKFERDNFNKLLEQSKLPSEDLREELSSNRPHKNCETWVDVEEWRKKRKEGEAESAARRD